MEERSPHPQMQGEDRERKGLRRKCRSGSESMSQRKIARRAWHGIALRGGGMQYIEERGTRRKEPRNLRDPKAKEGPGIK